MNAPEHGFLVIAPLGTLERSSFSDELGGLFSEPASELPPDVLLSVFIAPPIKSGPAFTIDAFRAPLLAILRFAIDGPPRGRYRIRLESMQAMEEGVVVDTRQDSNFVLPPLCSYPRPFLAFRLTTESDRRPQTTRHWLVVIKQYMQWPFDEPEEDPVLPHPHLKRITRQHIHALYELLKEPVIAHAPTNDAELVAAQFFFALFFAKAEKHPLPRDYGRMANSVEGLMLKTIWSALNSSKAKSMAEAGKALLTEARTKGTLGALSGSLESAFSAYERGWMDGDPTPARILDGSYGSGERSR